jgi:hypothetical protein
MKKAFSILLFLLGIACYGGSLYIEDQVAQGKIKLKDAQKNIDQTDQMLSLSPYTAPLGRGLKEASKGKIDEGKQQINYYTDFSSKLKLAGYILMGLGAISIPFAFRKKKK